MECTQALSTSTWCVPGTVSLLTGLTPSHHGVTNKVRFAQGRPETQKPLQLATSIKTLPELLKQRGYAVGAFTGQQTVDTFSNLGQRMHLETTGEKLCTFQKTVPAALAWMRTQHRQGKPWFALVHGYNPHGAVEPPEGYKDLYTRGYRGAYQGGSRDYLKVRDQAWLAKQQAGQFMVEGLTTADQAFFRGRYDERLHQADEQVRRLLTQARQAGLLDNTLVVITSDHGEEMFDHGAIGHGHTLYQELLHVPLLLHFPKQQHVGRITSRVSNLDAIPTMLDALGVPLPAGLDGQSLMGALPGPRVYQRKLAGPKASSSSRATERGLFPETDFLLLTRKRAICSDRYKLVLTQELGRTQLFDLVADPAEKHDLAEQQPERVQALKARLEAHSAATHPRP